VLQTLKGDVEIILMHLLLLLGIWAVWLTYYELEIGI